MNSAEPLACEMSGKNIGQIPAFGLASNHAGGELFHHIFLVSLPWWLRSLLSASLNAARTRRLPHLGVLADSLELWPSIWHR